MKLHEDIKRDAVALVTEQRYKVTEAARCLDINSNQLHRWKQQFAEEAAGTRLSGDDREELKRQARRGMARRRP